MPLTRKSFPFLSAASGHNNISRSHTHTSSSGSTASSDEEEGVSRRVFMSNEQGALEQDEETKAAEEEEMGVASIHKKDLVDTDSTIPTTTKAGAGLSLCANKRVRVAVFFAALFLAIFLGILGAYLGVLHSIDPPTISLTRMALDNMTFDGPAINALISFEGIVQNNCKYAVLIDPPEIGVYYPTYPLDGGEYLGNAYVTEIPLPSFSLVTKSAHATFLDVTTLGSTTHPRTATPLGKQLVDEVLQGRVSSFALRSVVHVRADILQTKMTIPFPAKLSLRCPFTNHWGAGHEGEVVSACVTELHPFWEKVKV